jgi:16S rRNA (cytosine967-C5)-methyltransferase
VSGLNNAGKKSTGSKRPGASENLAVEKSIPSHAPITPARSAAFAILERVQNSSAHSDDLLHGPGMAGLSQADRNLATALVLGVLRWQIALDARMQPLLQRPDQELASPVATALRLGAFQLLHMDRIPAHAALSESVELVRAAGHGHAAGMVNAILRKLQRQEPVKPKLFESTGAFAERLGHPAWLVERWVKHYGRAAALGVCECDQREPVPGELFMQVDLMQRMDDGSRLVAELAAALQPGARRMWDCCAAPGGKTMVLAERLPEAALLATDVNPKRVLGLAKRLESIPTVRVMEADALKLAESEGEFDLILCDVPCSGTGTLGRNPEIRLRLAPGELGRQAVRQKEILSAALQRLALGGRLLYSTCSLEPEENEAVLAATLAGMSGVVEVGLEAAMERVVSSGLLRGDVAGLLREGRLRTLPGVGFQGDGFFAAAFERVR